MNKNLLLVQTVSALFLLTLAGCSTSRHDANPSREYRVVHGWAAPGGAPVGEAERDDAELEKELNKAGGQGYAVVFSTTIPGDMTRKSKVLFILERPKK